MERKYHDGMHGDIKFFTGIEIEKTPAVGMETLFVVGVQDVNHILLMATNNNSKHIYFGANQSFSTKGKDDLETWSVWENMINFFLSKNYWCTLDVDVSEIEGLKSSQLIEWGTFIPQISVKIPEIHKLGYNATIKIDDIGFESTNPGVWCIPASELTQRKYFTDWNEYGKDKIL